MPFELGVPFEIALSLYSDSGFGSHAFTGSSSWAEIQLQLFDADGSAVTIFDPPAADVPEPGAGILSALGLITLLAFPAKARLASTRHKLKP